MAPPPPELNHDVVAEILLRLPPDDPAGLVRASAVCKPWLRTLTDPAFLSSYRDFHGTPRVLGLLHNPTGHSLARFVPTTAFRPRAAAAAVHRRCAVLDCRHGRVLLYDYGSTEFVVWDPVTGRERRIPGELPNVFTNHTVSNVYSSNHAVLCAAGANCDHSTCSGGPFLLATVGMDWCKFYHGAAFACFYSYETGARSIESYLELEYYLYFSLDDRSPTLVGGALYFVCDAPKLLRYDVLSRQSLSVINLPKAVHSGSVIVVPAEGGEFGLVSLYHSCFRLWLRETEVGRGASWVQHSVVDLKKLLPASNLELACLSGFAEGANVIFVSTDDGCVFSIDLNSMAVRKVCEMSHGSRIFPYVCFYTPAGAHTVGGNAQNNGLQQDFRLGLPRNQLLCSFPMMLPGARCYTDASTAADMTSPAPRKAGLGIFILNPTHNHKFYIKVQICNITSVIMAEAAAMAFAASIVSLLQVGEVSFLTDSQLLVNYFNGLDLNSPPHWEAKPFTQRFISSVANKRIQVLRVQRSMNITAHTLATQALRHPEILCSLPNLNCSSASHESSCPLSTALHGVCMKPFSIVAACCC